MAKQKRPGLLQRRAVVLEPQERKVYSLIQAINTIKKDKARKVKAKKEAYLEKKKKQDEKDEVAALAKRKETGKKIHKKMHQLRGK
jgi:ribosome biogenesis protein BMS1